MGCSSALGALASAPDELIVAGRQNDAETDPTAPQLAIPVHSLPEALHEIVHAETPPTDRHACPFGQSLCDWHAAPLPEEGELPTGRLDAGPHAANAMDANRENENIEIDFIDTLLFDDRRSPVAARYAAAVAALR